MTNARATYYVPIAIPNLVFEELVEHALQAGGTCDVSTLTVQAIQAWLAAAKKLDAGVASASGFNGYQWKKLFPRREPRCERSSTE